MAHGFWFYDLTLRPILMGEGRSVIWFIVHWVLDFLYVTTSYFGNLVEWGKWIFKSILEESSRGQAQSNMQWSSLDRKMVEKEKEMFREQNGAYWVEAYNTC